MTDVQSMKLLLISHFNKYIVPIKLWNFHLGPKCDLCAKELNCEVGGVGPRWGGKWRGGPKSRFLTFEKLYLGDY